MPSDQMRRLFSLDNAILFFSSVLLGWLLWYFYTGFGGPQELVSRLISVAVILQVLFMYREHDLYPWLPRWANQALVALYIGICVYVFWYFWYEFEEVAIYRQGSYTTQDYIVGLLIFLVVMELSRLAHPILFWMNVVLIA